MNDRTVEQDIASQQAWDGEAASAAANYRRMLHLLACVPRQAPDPGFAERITAAASRLEQRRKRRSAAVLATVALALAAGALAVLPWAEVITVFALSRLPAFPWPLLATVVLAAVAYRVMDGSSRRDAASR